MSKYFMQELLSKCSTQVTPFRFFCPSKNQTSSIGFLDRIPHLSSSFQTSSKYASILIEVQVKITKPGLPCATHSKTDQNDAVLTLPPHLELQVLHVRSHQVCGNGLDRLCYTAVFLQEEGQLVVVSLELLLLRKRSAENKEILPHHLNMTIAQSRR